MPNVKRLGKGASKAISNAIDEMFDRAKVRFLGPQSVLGKRIYIGFEREKSLPGIFEAGSIEERVNPDLEVLEALLDIAGNYIDATRNRTKARVINEINSAILNARHQDGGLDRQAFRDMVNTKLSEVWGEVTNNIHTIVDTEVSRAKNTSVLDGIIGANAAAGIGDPTIYFVVVRDGDLCDECKRLHLMPNKVTPRLWKLSELGHGYHEKGDDHPKIGGLHPHCRCTLVTLMPGYYFDSGGKVMFKKPGFDGYEWQHRLDRSEQEEGEDLVKGWKGMVAAGALATLAPTIIGHETPPVPTATVERAPSVHPNLRLIGQLETSGGKNLDHAAHSKGKFHTAYGEFGLKPIVAHEHYLKSRELQKKYPGLRDPKAFLKRFTSHRPFYEAVAGNVWSSLNALHQGVKNPTERTLRAVFGWRWGRTASKTAPFAIVHADPYVRRFSQMQASHGAIAYNKSEDLDKAFRWRDLESEFTNNGWTLARQGGEHIIYKHPTVPANLALKHEHKHGEIRDWWVEKYAKDVGLMMDPTGKHLIPNPNHPNAQYYIASGHLKDPNAKVTWEPREPHTHVPIGDVMPMMNEGALQPHKIAQLRVARANNREWPPVRVAMLEDARVPADDDAEHLLAAAKQAGMTHVPIIETVMKREV